MKVNREIKRILKEFHNGKKYIGLTGISSLLAAKVFQNTIPKGIKLTLGKHG